MKIISSSPGFSILHAISNPEFPAELWPELIESNRNMKYIEGIDYKTTALKYGFVFTSLSFNSEEYDAKSTWSLLDFAILNFNSTAVKKLLEAFEFKDDEIKSAVNMTKLLGNSLNDAYVKNNFYMPRLSTITSFRNQNQPLHTDFFRVDINSNSLNGYFQSYTSHINIILCYIART